LPSAIINKIGVDVDIVKTDNYIDITAVVKGCGKTGFEMGVATASVAALILYVMYKIYIKE